MSVKRGLPESRGLPRVVGGLPPVPLVSVLLVLVLLASCTASKVDSDAVVSVSGTVDAPASEVTVGLLEVPDLGELLVGSTVAIGTLGAVCLAEDPPAACGDARTATPADDGTYSFSLDGADTKGTAGQASDFEVTARHDGLVSTVRFVIQVTELTLPTLRFWDVTPEVVADEGALRVSWPAVGSEFGEDPRHQVRFVDAETGALVWNVPDASSGDVVSARFLEDRSGRVEVTATTESDGPDTTFRSTVFARPVDFVGAPAPPSRGLACAATTAEGETTAIESCPLTDGIFDEASGLSEDGVVRSGAFVDLGESRTVDLVVARGAIGPITVETSSDAVSWDVVGTSTGSLAAVEPGRPAAVRYVRVRTTNGTDLSNLAEISVWW